MNNNKLRGRVGLLILVFFLVLTVPSWVLAQEYPSPTPVFYVNDYADVIDPQTEEIIERNGARLEELTSAQVVVVTMNGIGEDKSLVEYTLGLFREWGIGQEEENNGVLIFLDLEGRYSRIEIGYGLEGILPDGKTGRIQDSEMLPYYQQADYSQGILNGYNAIVNEIYKEYGFDEEYVGSGPIAEETQPDQDTQEEPTNPLLKYILLISIIPLIILDFKFTGGMITFTIIRLLTRGGFRGGGGGRSGGGGSAGGGGSSRGF